MAELLRAGQAIPPFDFPIRDTARSKSPEAVEVLAAVVSDISEEQWCASWLIDCEFYFWAGWHCSVRDLDELQALHDECGGWVVYELAKGDEPDPGWIFLPTAEWLPRFEAWAARRNPKPEAMLHG